MPIKRNKRNSNQLINVSTLMIKKLLPFVTFLCIVLLSTEYSFSQQKTTFGQKIKIKKLLNEGKILVYENNYRKALNVFRTVLSYDSSNATANFRIAECHLNLDKPRLGKKYALRAINLNPETNTDVYFVLAESYHRLGELELAKEYYQNFKEKSSKNTNEDYDTDNRIKQCEYAKTCLENPVDATAENMGRKINSFNPEYAGSISANGQTLVFTSRRADTKGGQVDEIADNMYFEDIYISYWNDSMKEWSQSEPIEGSINTPVHDAVLSISPNGNSIYVYKSENGGDIFVSRKREDGTFGTANSIDEGRNVNSSYFESSASVTEDENFIYFVSDRPGGNGQADIYTARRIGNEWTKPINLGDSINSEGDENSVFIHPSGDLLFFTSTGHDGMGSYDIFYSKRINGKWSKAKNLGYPINTVGSEKTISVTKDLKTAYVSSNYKGSYGSTDIFKIDLSKMKF